MASTADTLRHALTFKRPRIGLRVTFSDSDIELTNAGPQKVEVLAGALNLDPWRYLSLHALYRLDTRAVALAPEIQGELAEVGLSLDFGLFTVTASAFESVDHFVDFGDQRNTGLRWSIRRQFSGWLPIVTGVRARGTVR